MMNEREKEYTDELPKVEYLTPRHVQKSDKKSGRNNQRTKHASPWKETAATRDARPRKTTWKAEHTKSVSKTKKENRDSGNIHFLLLSIGIAAGVLVTAGALVYISLLFLH